MKHILLLCLSLAAAPLSAQSLRLAKPYTDGMVLQRHQTLNIEGTAQAGCTVSVTLGTNRATATADSGGHWCATLPSMTAGTGYTLTATTGSETVTCADVAIGEVWVSSGQSNMAFMLRQAIGGKDEAAQAHDPLLRFLDMKPRYETTSAAWSDEARQQVDSYDYYRPTKWQPSNPQTAAEMSAIGYYFGRMLRDSLQVPVGIINNAIGGAPTEAWTDLGTLRAYAPEVLDNWQNNALIQDWVRQRAAENVGNGDLHQHPYKPAYLFDTGIRPLDHYAVAGVVWYQGESNAHNTVLHERLFELLVQSWRQYWQRPSLPFAFVQLSSIARPTWPAFRDSQRRLAARLPMTGMAVSSDVGDSLDVHPRLKRPVGERLARWALHHVYSFGHVTPSGPLPVKCVMRNAQCVMHNAQCTMHNAQCVIDFEYGQGLCAADGKALRTFEVAGDDGVFHAARATVVTDGQIRVECTEVQAPRFVRYGWQPFTRANMINSDGLPASTFCIPVEVETDGYMAGVSGAFAGMVDGKVIVAGGCNFPENPLAKVSTKQFYDHICIVEDGELRRIGSLPHPIAYGVSATTPEGLVLMGGHGSSDCHLLRLTGDGNAQLSPLPALPCTVDNAGACYAGGKVYIAGGNHGGQPSNALLRLDEKGWTQLPPFPGNPRTQPVVATGRNRKGEECVWVFGGFAGSGSSATLDTDGWVYVPSKNKWQHVEGPVGQGGTPLSLAGGTACAMPDGTIRVAGGVNRDIFLAAIRSTASDYLSHGYDWYSFNPLVLSFDPTTELWSILYCDPEAARAGASIVPLPDGRTLLYGGEVKPRIRTPKIRIR